MKKQFSKLVFFLLTISVGVICFNAQTPTDDSLVDDEQIKAESLCRQIPMKAERTYVFRALPKATLDDGAPYGAKPWYQKLFPFLAKEKRIDDILAIEKELARPIPFGESKRSKEIRLNSENKLLEMQQTAEQNWNAWLKQNPNAAKDEIEKAEKAMRYQGLAATRLPRFDWREQGLDAGEVGFQGFNCNTCWAFASVDAMQMNRQLVAIRARQNGFENSPSASVQQLISCMVPNKEDFCKINWHGAAFTYLVDKGLPLGGPTLYKARDSKLWTCDSETYVKALTWDFVSADPRKVATTEEIKRALILYGPVVSMIRFDKCLWLYGGGIFNGENNQEGTHLILIIGWDDEKGAWRIKNSYGKKWGEKGFGWIKYGSNNIGESSAWMLADPKEEARIAKEFSEKQ
jgi:C1A family cysteine protease